MIELSEKDKKAARQIIESGYFMNSKTALKR